MNQIKIIKFLEELKTIHRSPRLYLANHFANLKNQVDIECTHFLGKLLDTKLKKPCQSEATLIAAIFEDQSNIINEINSFEQECFSKQTTDELTNKDHELIGGDFSEISMYDGLRIYEILMRIRAELFLNKGMLFQGRESDFFEDECFHSLGFEMKSFGLLLVVEDAFICDETCLKE